jgi:hypothetical protein
VQRSMNRAEPPPRIPHCLPSTPPIHLPPSLPPSFPPSLPRPRPPSHLHIKLVPVRVRLQEPVEAPLDRIPHVPQLPGGHVRVLVTDESPQEHGHRVGHRNLRKRGKEGGNEGGKQNTIKCGRPRAPEPIGRGKAYGGKLVFLTVNWM